jgi:hypothetical protein
MRRLSAWLAVGVAVGLLVGCKETGEVPVVETPTVEVAPPVAPPVTPPVMPPAVGVVTLEVETFKLDEAEVRDLAGASGGKAVLFNSETSGAETSVPLKKGTYEVTLYMQGADEDHDAVYLSVAGIENRLYADEWGRVVVGAVPDQERFTVAVPKDGPCKVVLLAAETDVYLDRVVLKLVK